MSKYKCDLCPYVYDEEKEVKKWEELPSDWTCPECGVPKEFFTLVVEINNSEPSVKKKQKEARKKK
jgi:rubredoxin